MKQIFLLLLLLIGALVGKSQLSENMTLSTENISKVAIQDQVQKQNIGRINFFVFTKEKSKKFDLLSWYTLARARIKSFFHHNKLYIIKVESSIDAAKKIENILIAKNKLLNGKKITES